MELDNSTIRAREKKIWERLEAHVANYLRRAAAEVEDRKRQASVYEAQFAADVPAMQASHARFEALVTPELKAVAASTRAEAQARQAADSAFVSSMQTAMARLRRDAIENFGGGDDDEDEDD
jgi:cell division septum initiation protein DivIVA